MHIQRELERLGYNHNEITVYLAMMRLGETTVTEIARKTQLPRSTTQLTVQSLQKRGLAALTIRRNNWVWIAENPSKFLLDLHDKEVLLQKLLPELQLLRHESKKKPILKFYSGINSINVILETVVQSQYSVKVLGSVPHMCQYLGVEMVEDFFEKMFKGNVQIQLLSTTSDFVLNLKKQSESGKNRVRLFDDEHLTQVVYILFNSQVAIILLSAQESIGVVFADVGMAESTSLFFDQIWKNRSIETI